MGWFSRKKETAPDLYLIDEKCDGYWFDIVGESRCRDHLMSFIRNAGEEQREAGEIETLAQLLPEPGNEFDPNAIQVWIGNGRVGYIGKNQTAMFHPRLIGAKGARVFVLARIGWDSFNPDPPIGVRLRLRDKSSEWRVMTRDEMAAEAGVE